MDFRLTEEEERYKQTFLAWLQENLPAGLADHHFQIPESWDDRVALYRDFHRRLYQAGYAGILYPKKYGGQGGSFIQNIMVTEALGPWHVTIGGVNWVGHGMAGPTVLARGTEEQKEEFIPKLLNGDHIWCQGFSEPNAGSDLGNVTTRAVKDGDNYIITGQKTWTTMAHKAQYCLLLARTNPMLAKHKGLSYFLVDMNLPGITVRPLVQISEDTEFNEVYFDEVRVPRSMMVGEEGQGWRVVLTTLEFERVIGDVAMVSGMWWQYEGILEMSRKLIKNGQPVSKDPHFRQKMVQCFIELMISRYTGYRSVSKIAKGQMPGPEGSIGKLFWSELGQRLTELAMEVQGPFHQLMRGSPWAVAEGYWQHDYLYSKCLTLAGGTTEIQKNIIGERVLGLPKDTARALITEGR
jgi:alkylation response protein AidB-like acyl-CoA dehydrogenase